MKRLKTIKESLQSDEYDQEVVDKFRWAGKKFDDFNIIEDEDTDGNTVFNVVYDNDYTGIGGSTKREAAEKLKTHLDSMISNEAASQNALSVELKPAQFNVALKQVLKTRGAKVKSVRIVNAYNWPKCYVQVYGEMPNDLRLAALKADDRDLSGISNLDDIHYGNITGSGITVHAGTWVKALSVHANEAKVAKRKWIPIGFVEDEEDGGTVFDDHAPVPEDGPLMDVYFKTKDGEHEGVYDEGTSCFTAYPECKLYDPEEVTHWAKHRPKLVQRGRLTDIAKDMLDEKWRKVRDAKKIQRGT